MYDCYQCRLRTNASVAALEPVRDSLCKSILGKLTRMAVLPQTNKTGTEALCRRS